MTLRPTEVFERDPAEFSGTFGRDPMNAEELGWRREHAARVWQCFGALACVVNVYCTGWNDADNEFVVAFGHSAIRVNTGETL